MVSGRRAVVLFAMLALAAAIAAAWLAPATLLDTRIAGATGGMVRLADTAGTLWNGRGSLVATATRMPIAWRVECWPLLQGVLRVRLASGTGAATPRAIIEAGIDTLAFRDVDVTLPAQVFGATLSPFGVASVAGEISLKADAIEWTPVAGRGEVRLLWQAGRVAFTGSATPLDLGEVRMLATANGKSLSGPITNDGGDLALRGEWALRAHDSAQLSLHVAPRRPGLVALERALSAIGTADGNGWRIAWGGALR
jgi:Type II secretion system (T2SS), protein N